MSIPKIIHYCWFGGGPISPESRKCMESWKKYCPDYKIMAWTEQNFDISANRYAQQAYAAKKYAFVSDYARLAVLYEYGGIYLDTDVELVRPLDELLVFLASNKGIALSREKILQKVWNYDYFGEDRTVDTHVKMLRGHLGKCRSYIATVWGIGYKFDPDATR